MSEDIVYKYTVVVHEELLKLVDTVNKSLENGWELVGGMTPIPRGPHYEPRYAQAMKKDRLQLECTTKLGESNDKL